MRGPLLQYFLCYQVDFSGVREEDVYQFVHDNRLDCWGYFKADYGFSLFFSPRGKRALEKDTGMRAGVSGVRSRGLLSYLFQKRARAGLVLGGAVAALLLLFLSGLVWDVRIEGNERYTDDYLKERLAKNGLAVGTVIAAFDRGAFAAKYLQNEEELAYLAVNFRGTVAYVQVLERLAPPEEEVKTGGANLVATVDAVIHSLSVTAGTPLVHVGAVVRAGEGLVSGIIEGAEGSRIVYAAGEVIGRVRHTLTVEVAREQVEKSVSHLTLNGISLNFWGRELNIFKKYSNLDIIYDTIYKNKCFYAAGALLPVSFRFAYIPQYEERVQMLSEGEMVNLALSQMNEKLSLFLQDKELLSRRLDGRFDGDRYLLTCEIECLENIAATQEFSLE